MNIKKIITGLSLSMLLSSGMAVAAAWDVISFTDDFSDKSFYEVRVRSNAGDSTLGLQCGENRLALFVVTKTLHYLHFSNI